MEMHENCARRIQTCWRSYRDRRVFRLLMNTLRTSEQSLALAVLRKLSPKEAELLKDPSLKFKVRFRFAGSQFPPSVVFKIFHIGGVGHYLSGKKLFVSSNQATADTCRMMGNRSFMDLISLDEIQRQRKAITELPDIICMRDYMQYSSHLDELPAYLGGRENGWRFLSLKVLSRDTREGSEVRGSGAVSAGIRRELLSGHLTFPQFAGQQPSQRRSVTSTRCSARARNTAARKRRLYSLDDSQRVLDRERQKVGVDTCQTDSITSYNTNKQNRTAENCAVIFIPSAETEACSDSSSESEWEEEAAKLCDWSKQLHLDDVMI